MQIDRFFSIIAATITFCGAIFVIAAAFRLTPDFIARLSSTTYEALSLERLRNLAEEKAYVVSGAILIFFAFLLQIVPLVLIQEEWQILDDHYKIAVYLAISLSIILVLLVFGLNDLFSSYFDERAKRAVVKTHIERALQQDPVERAYWNSTVACAESLLGIRQGTEETDMEFLRRLAEELRVRFPRAGATLCGA